MAGLGGCGGVGTDTDAPTAPTYKMLWSARRGQVVRDLPQPLMKNHERINHGILCGHFNEQGGTGKRS